MSRAAEYSPDIVAGSFIKQFYEMLAKNPSELHRFYKEESYFTHSEGQQVTNAVQGVESIRKRVGELNLAGARVDLTEGSVDAQRSDNNGVFLMITGEFTQPDMVPRRFVQTFFLACASGTAASSYFVRNSVFRLLGPAVPTASVSTQSFTAPSVDATTSTATQAASVEISLAPQPPAAAVVSQPVPAPAAHAPAPAPVVAAPTAVVSAPVEEDTVEEQAAAAPAPPVAAVESKQVKPSVPAAAVAAPATTEKPAAPQPEPAVAAAPVASASKTYSDMVKKLLPNGASSAPASTPAPARPAAVAPRKAPAQPSSSVSSAAGEEGHHQGDSTGAGKSNAFALYIKQLPEDASEAELREMFGSFGAIKSVTTHSGRNFAFVEFEAESGLKAVLDCNKPFEFRGSALKVEERNAGGRGGSKSSGDKKSSGGAAGGTGSGGGNRSRNAGGDNKGRGADGSSENKGRSSGDRQQRRDGDSKQGGGERRGGDRAGQQKGGQSGQRASNGSTGGNIKATSAAGDANRPPKK